MEAITVSSPSSNPDLDLAERHRYGDPQAFEEVYDRYASMVYSLALRLAGKPSEAEDLAQEVFLRIYRHLGRFNGRSTLKTWVYRVTINHCRSRLGRLRRLFQLPVDDEGREQTDWVDERRGPEARALAHDAVRRVTAALQQVKPSFREAVVLRDIEELSYEEIASVLGIRIGTVRSRIARGREQLRRVLESES